MSRSQIRAVLFDLDGTLLDTAPDMIVALNTLLAQQGRAPLPYALARTQVSHGSTGMLRQAFPEVAAGDEFEALRQRFLSLYGSRLTQETALFTGCDAVLDTLAQKNISWGIVTNKPAFLTEPLLAALGLAQRAACVVSGDTLAERKPHPAPLLHAAKLLAVAPQQCIYVGDAQRDVQSAHAAGMRVLLALYGYLGPQDQPDTWQADAQIQSPLEILHWLDA
jgi:phosphoglycolate phosphatase